jgi:hypothetical protein
MCFKVSQLQAPKDTKFLGVEVQIRESKIEPEEVTH